jgi:hypothetical protein
MRTFMIIKIKTAKTTPRRTKEGRGWRRDKKNGRERHTLEASQV